MEETWIIYSKPEGRCPHCENAKKFFKEKNIDIEIHIVEDKDKENTFKQLKDKIGSHKTFPIIFKGDEFIGGYSKLQEYIKHNPNLFVKENTYDMKIIKYLKSSFENSCIILPKHEDKNTLIPEEYWSSMEICTNTKRFTLFPFQILCNDKYYQNFMIYDNIKKTLERFDPHNLKDNCSQNTITEIDNQIVQLFKLKMGKDFVETYYTPLYNCLNNKHLNEDLCVYLYAYERLNNPDTDRNDINIYDKLYDFTEDYNDF